MPLHDIDRDVIAHMASRTPDGLSAVYQGLAAYALARFEAVPEGPEKERWGVAWSIARDACFEMKALEL